MTPQLEHQIIQFLGDTEKTVATAESCSGGLIAHRLTNVPGASAPFVGGIVAYRNEVKMDLLAVPEDTLQLYGAVSQQTALAMAEGARAQFGSDFAVAVTGIAGPGGGTDEKPVGLVYMAVARTSATEVARHEFEGDRESIKQQISEAALALLWENMNK
ncbi:MAG: CinA family protein [Candidatus Hydrogenedentes bacterium]|nr:CinA family protein [Candidatus Hydrogenedentota bacterium]